MFRISFAPENIRSVVTYESLLSSFTQIRCSTCCYRWVVMKLRFTRRSLSENWSTQDGAEVNDDPGVCRWSFATLMDNIAVRHSWRPGNARPLSVGAFFVISIAEVPICATRTRRTVDHFVSATFLVDFHEVDVSFYTFCTLRLNGGTDRESELRTVLVFCTGKKAHLTHCYYFELLNKTVACNVVICTDHVFMIADYCKKQICISQKFQGELFF